MIPGDDDIEPEQVNRILDPIDQADIVIPFIDNAKCSHLMNRVYSHLFTFLLNTLFSCNLKYYNVPVLDQTSFLKKVYFRLRKYTYQAERLIKLIKIENCSYKHIGFEVNERKYGESKAVCPPNFADVFYFIFSLFCEVRLKIPKAIKSI